MALFKKILPSSISKKKSKESLESTSSGSSVGSSASLKSPTSDNQADLFDIFLLDVKYKDKRDALNFHFGRHKRRNRKLSVLKQGLVEMDHETRELQRMITKTEAEIKALESERKDKMEELEAILSLIDLDTEVEIKKREPLLFKRYSNLKSASESTNLLKVVRQKQKALQQIELLTYRKYIKFQHGGPGKPEKEKRKFHSLIPIKPARLKDCRPFGGDKGNSDVTFVAVEDQKDENPDVIDLTGEDDPQWSPFDVPPLESEV